MNLMHETRQNGLKNDGQRTVHGCFAPTFKLQRQSLQSVDAASCSHSVHACTMLALIFARQKRFHEFHDKEFVFFFANDSC